MSNAKRHRIICPAIFLTLLNFALFPELSNAQVDDQARKTAYEIFKQLIEIDTTDSAGNVTAAADAMHKRFVQAGFTQDDLFLGGPTEKKKNLVVRYRGTGEHKPILFIGHLDVVEAPAEHWSTNPFQLVEKDGFYYGRGTQDMKNNDATLVTMLLQFKREAYKPDRDLILALTADEEGGSANGVEWLLKNHRTLVDAEYVLNPDGAGVDFEYGKPVAFNVDATEKLYGDFLFTATNPGGHSSMPVTDNAI